MADTYAEYNVRTRESVEAEKKAADTSNVRTVTDDGQITGSIMPNQRTYKTKAFKQGPSFETKMATKYKNLEEDIMEDLSFDSFEGQLSYYSDDESDLFGIKSKKKGGAGLGGAIGNLFKPLAPKNLISGLFNRNNNSPAPAPAPAPPAPIQQEQKPIDDIQYNTEAPIDPKPEPKKILGMNQTTAIIVIAVVVVVIIAIVAFVLKGKGRK